jgi:hypothetical protein
MKTNSRNSQNKSGKKAELAAREIRACTVCGARFSALADSESCPMCVPRQALAGGVESSEFSSEDAAKPLPERPPRRFDHYQVAIHADVTNVELGRGAMGITFKAFDTVLGIEVALKVIDTRIAASPEAREPVKSGEVQLWVLRRAKLGLRFAKPSESRGSRSRFRC